MENFVKGNTTEIGLRLRAARQKRGLTIPETINALVLKGHMTTSISDIEAIEFGTRRITEQLLVILCTEIYQVEIRLIGGWTLAAFESDQEVIEAYHAEDDAKGVSLTDAAEWFGVDKRDASKILKDGHREWVSRYTLARVAYDAKRRASKPDERAAVIPFELLTDGEINELEQMAGDVIAYFVKSRNVATLLPQIKEMPNAERTVDASDGISSEVSEHRTDGAVEPGDTGSCCGKCESD